MRKRAENKHIRLARALTKVKRKHANHKYLDNIVERIKWDFEYKEIRIKFQNRIVCAYCGEKASGMDHVIPLSEAREYVASYKEKGIDAKLYKVSCCGECNRLLGPSIFSAFEIKLQHLRKRLARKYKDLDPDDKVLIGRLNRRLNFNRGLNRMKNKK